MILRDFINLSLECNKSYIESILLSVMETFEELNDSIVYYYRAAIRRKIEIIETLITLVILALCMISILSYSFYKEAVTDQILNLGYSGMFVLSAVLEFVPQVLNPFFVIIGAISAGFNVHLSIIAVTLG